MAECKVFEGLVRLVHTDFNDNTLADLLEKTAGVTGEFYIKTKSGANAEAEYTTDPRVMPKVKKVHHIMGAYDKLVIKVKPKADVTVASGREDKAVIRIPVTFRNVRSGVVYEKTLYTNDFTAEVAGGATLKANIWYTAYSYQIPAQTEMKLGHIVQDARVDSAIYFGWTTQLGTA